MGKLKRSFLVALGISISLAALVFVLARLDWTDFAREFHNLRAVWILASCTCVALAITSRALRWCLLASVPLRYLPAFWRASVFGVFANFIYPLRAGELLRIFAVRAMAKLPFGRAATSAVLDRLTDVVGLGATALLVFGNRLGMAAAEHATVATLIVAFGLLLLLLLSARYAHFWQRIFRAWAMRVSERFHQRLERFLDEAIATVRALFSASVVSKVALLALLSLGFDYGVVLFAMFAFDWNVSSTMPLLLLIFLAVATALPSGPAYVGTYQLACVLALSAYGYHEETSVAFSILLQVSVIVTTAFLAFVAGFAKIRRRASLEAEAVEAAGVPKADSTT